MKNMLFVMNPYAGQRKAIRFLWQIVDIFNRAEYDVRVYMTAGPGDAKRYVGDNVDDADLVVCCGGDGTFNETVAGIMESGKPIPIGYIPAGSTNDFASGMGITTDILQAARDIVCGKPEWLDLGSFGGRYFSYVASFGAFTKASYTTPQNVKNALGHTAYVLSGIQEISQLKPKHVRLTLDDGTVYEDEYLFGAISNSTSVGGVLTLAEDVVDMRDGKFEVLLVRAPRNLTELADCIKALQNKTYNCAMVSFFSTSRVTVSASEDMPWTLDGEKEEGKTAVDVVNIHKAVQVILRGDS